MGKFPMDKIPIGKFPMDKCPRAQFCTSNELKEVILCKIRVGSPISSDFQMSNLAPF